MHSDDDGLATVTCISLYAESERDIVLHLYIFVTPFSFPLHVVFALRLEFLRIGSKITAILLLLLVLYFFVLLLSLLLL